MSLWLGYKCTWPIRLVMLSLCATCTCNKHSIVISKAGGTFQHVFFFYVKKAITSIYDYKCISDWSDSLYNALLLKTKVVFEKLFTYLFLIFMTISPYLFIYIVCGPKSSILYILAPRYPVLPFKMQLLVFFSLRRVFIIFFVPLNSSQCQINERLNTHNKTQLKIRQTILVTQETLGLLAITDIN